MTDKPEPKDAKEPRPIIHLGMMGYGTEEQNLGERGDPAKRITEDEADAAFNPPAPRKKPRLASSMTRSRRLGGVSRKIILMIAWFTCSAGSQ